MRIKWLGHACFEITTSENVVIIIDPYDASSYGEEFSYEEKFSKADLVLLSHHHFDHGNYKAVPGNPNLIEKAGDSSFQQIKVKGIPTFHDSEEGKNRGENLIFLIDDQELKLVHCGDLGHKPDASTMSLIFEIDILLIPVGGFYTIDAQTAWEIVKEIKPKVVIPMHYKNDKCKFPIASVDEFIKGRDSVIKLCSNELEIEKDNISSQTVINILEPSN